MSLESDLTGRSGGVCELCGMKNARTACDVPPKLMALLRWLFCSVGLVLRGLQVSLRMHHIGGV